MGDPPIAVLTWKLLALAVCCGAVLCSFNIRSFTFSRFKASANPYSPAFQQAQGTSVVDDALENVYKLANLSLCPQSNATCWPRLYKPLDCKQLFSEYASLLKTHMPPFPPPATIPPQYKQQFLLDGHVNLSDYYFAQPNHAPSTTVVWEAVNFRRLVETASSHPESFGSYNTEVQNIYQALACHPVKGQKGAVFGSETPWLEALLFAFNASQLTTIEFRATEAANIDNLQVITPLQWAQRWQSNQLPSVDFAFSFSSWEHDGLGRYGDPVDAWGDIKAVQRASCYVKPGGLLYVGVPSAATDQLHFNAHRIYGPMRFPLLTANWEVLGVYEGGRMPRECGSSTCSGLFPHWAGKVPLGAYAFHPVVVLRNWRTAPCT